MMKKQHTKRQPIYFNFFAVLFFLISIRQAVVWFLTMFFLHANKHPIIIKGKILYFCNITFQNELSFTRWIPSIRIGIFSNREKKTKFITIKKGTNHLLHSKQLEGNWKHDFGCIKIFAAIMINRWSCLPFFSSSFATIWYWFSAIVCNCWYQKKNRTNEKRTETINSECQTPIMIKCTMRNNLPRIDCVPHTKWQFAFDLHSN